jgi:hypothetical protein
MIEGMKLLALLVLAAASAFAQSNAIEWSFVRKCPEASFLCSGPVVGVLVHVMPTDDSVEIFRIRLTYRVGSSTLEKSALVERSRNPNSAYTTHYFDLNPYALDKLEQVTATPYRADPVMSRATE